MPLSHSCFLTSLFILTVFLYSPFSFLFLYSLFSSLFSVVFFLAIFSHLFFLILCLPLVVLFPPLATLHCAHLRPFYTTYNDKFYCFTPQLLLAWCGCPSQTTHWSVGCPAITNTLCWLCHIPFLNKRVLFCFLALCGIPIQIRVGYSLLLTPMACT